MQPVAAHIHDASEFSVSTALTYAALGCVVVAGIVIAAPYALPALGVGSADMATRAMWLLHESSAIAGEINEMLAAVPVIGQNLAEGGMFNAVATAIVGLGGMVIGNKVEENAETKNGELLGQLIKYGALATSALIALPTVLTALGSGIIFLSTLTNDASFARSVAGWVNDTMGTIGGTHHATGTSGIAAALPHLLTCGTALLPAAFHVKLHHDNLKEQSVSAPYVARNTKGEPLPAHDRNHAMTPEEIQLTETYNAATPAKKILLKRDILEKGYDPDFHADGTMHLYKHGHGHGAQTAMMR